MISLRPSRHPIGIDVGLYGARMLQLDACTAEPQTPRVLAAARTTWPEDVRQQIEGERTPPVALIARHLARLANRGQFRGRDVALTLPREIVRVKNLRLPLMPADEAIGAAEIDARMLFEVDEQTANVQVFPAGEVRQGNEGRLEMIAACVMRRDVDALVEAWHRAGFRPASLDFEPVAIYRAVDRFVRRRDDEAEVNVIVEIGHRRTNILIGRGRQLSFVKGVEIGGAQLTRAVARKLSLDAADALVLRHRLAANPDASRHDAGRAGGNAGGGDDPVRQAVIDGVRPIVEELGRELALCLRYFSVNFRGQRPVRVRVVGGESADPTVLRLLGNALPVPVEACAPIRNADVSQMPAAERGGPLGEWTHAFGLALRFTAGPFADRTGPTRAAVAVSGAADASASMPTPIVALAPVALATPEVARA